MADVNPAVLTLAMLAVFALMGIGAIALGKSLRAEALRDDADREARANEYDTKAAELEQDADFIAATFPSIARETRAMAKGYRDRAASLRRRVI